MWAPLGRTLLFALLLALLVGLARAQGADDSSDSLLSDMAASDEKLASEELFDAFITTARVPAPAVTVSGDAPVTASSAPTTRSPVASTDDLASLADSGGFTELPVPVTTSAPRSALSTFRVLPLWAIIVLSLSSAAFVAGVALLVLFLILSLSGSRRSAAADPEGYSRLGEGPATKGGPSKLLPIMGAILLVLGGAGIGVSLGLGLRQASAVAISTRLMPFSGGFQTYVHMPAAVDRHGRPVRSRRVYYMSWFDPITREFKAAPTAPRVSARSSSLPAAPLPGAAIEGVLERNADGSVSLAEWKALPASRASTNMKLGVFMITLKGSNQCGNVSMTEECVALCPTAKMRDLVLGERGIKRFTELASRGTFSMDVSAADFFELQMDPPARLMDMAGLVHKATNDAARKYTNMVYVFPANYRRDWFSDGVSVGFGDVGGSNVWLIGCSFQSLIHELGHNLRLAHSGLVKEGKFVEYGDRSSIMSSARFMNVPNADGTIDKVETRLAWRGFNPVQLSILGWLPASAVTDADLRTSRQYTLKSLSSNDRSGAAVLRVALPTDTYYVSWREAVNQDADMGSDREARATAPFTYVGTLLVHHEQQSTKFTELDGVVSPSMPLTLPGGVTIVQVGPGVVGVQVGGGGTFAPAPPTRPTAVEITAGPTDAPATNAPAGNGRPTRRTTTRRTTTRRPR